MYMIMIVAKDQQHALHLSNHIIINQNVVQRIHPAGWTASMSGGVDHGSHGYAHGKIVRGAAASLRATSREIDLLVGTTALAECFISTTATASWASRWL